MKLHIELDPNDPTDVDAAERTIARLRGVPAADVVQATPLPRSSRRHPIAPKPATRPIADTTKAKAKRELRLAGYEVK